MNRFQKVFRQIIFVTSGISILIGLTVIIGWLTSKTTLIQILPSFVPMQFNTALGFFLCGLALLAIQLQQIKLGKSLGLFAGMIGLLTIFEYLLNINIGIDELFIEHDIVVKTSHPGRMAPNTALCFFLSSIAILLNKKKRLDSVLKGNISSLIFGLGLVAFIGYFIGIESTYGWGQLTKMAIHTAFGFITLGIGFTVQSWIKNESDFSKKNRFAKRGIIGYIASLSITLFLIDMNSSSYMSTHGLYILLIFFGWLLKEKYSPILLASIATSLILTTVIFKNETDLKQSIQLSNRFFSIFSIWVVALLVYFLRLRNLLLKQATEELRKKLIELEMQNKELEQFAYIASHDLQEPLKTITSYTDLLNEKFKSDLSPQTSKILSFLNQAANRMSLLIKDLLDYARISKGLKAEKIDTNQLLKEIIADSVDLVEEYNPILKIKPLPTLVGIKPILLQLFKELITNAIKYRNTERRIEIEISCKEVNDLYEFKIKDNGIGISDEYFDKIFIIFQRLHGKNSFTGTGIGLAHCKKIVNLHGGNISVESKLNQGSTFTFTLKNRA